MDGSRGRHFIKKGGGEVDQVKSGESTSVARGRDDLSS